MSFHVDYEGLRPEELPPYDDLGGNSTEDINLYSGIILAAVVCVTVCGALYDFLHRETKGTQVGGLVLPSGHAREGRKAWLICMSVASYVLLIPGLFTVLFSFDVVLKAFGTTIPFRPEETYGEPVVETMWSMVALLRRTGSLTAASLLVLYSMLIPASKIGALLLAEFFRRRNEEEATRYAKKLITYVQFVSKWACPDMFAYILLQHLIRGLYHPPMITAGARLDVGFACFSVFCICSTISSLGVPVPLDEASSQRSYRVAQATPFAIPNPEVWQRYIGVIAVALSCVSIAFLVVGLQSPVMALQVDTAMLFKANGGPLADASKPMVNGMVSAMLNTEVSIMECLKSLLRWMWQGEAISVFGFVLYAVFVVGLTVLDLIILVAASFGVCTGPALRAVQVIKKLAMLDVSVVGIVVVKFCANMYSDHGIIISLRGGLVALLFAEAAHYACFYLVTGVLDDVILAEHMAGGKPDTETSMSHLYSFEAPDGVLRPDDLPVSSKTQLLEGNSGSFTDLDTEAGSNDSSRITDAGKPDNTDADVEWL